VPVGCSSFGRWVPMTCWLVCTQTVAERVDARLELLAAFGKSLGCSGCMNAAAALGKLDLACTAKHPKPFVAEDLYTIAWLADRSVRRTPVVHYPEKTLMRKKCQSWHWESQSRTAQWWSCRGIGGMPFAVDRLCHCVDCKKSHERHRGNRDRDRDRLVDDLSHHHGLSLGRYTDCEWIQWAH
jgi:hypothetical protein